MGARALTLAFCLTVGCGSDPAAVPQQASLTRRTAIATLVAVADSGGLVSGSARFTTTLSAVFAVDLTLTTSGCGSHLTYPVRIIEPDACETADLHEPAWDDPRGADIPDVVCTGSVSGVGKMTHTRTQAVRDRAWSIGADEASDVVGKALAIFDPTTGKALACGLIMSGPDAPSTPLPSLTEGPPQTVRAMIAGACLLRSFGPANLDNCPDVEAMVACGADHCELGACLEDCAQYGACLADLADPCVGDAQCVASEACTMCQAEVLQCELSFCTGAFACAPITPGGPCSQLEACCALQGEEAPACLKTFQALATFGGDPSCYGATMDWDVISHLHVPCSFGD